MVLFCLSSCPDIRQPEDPPKIPFIGRKWRASFWPVHRTDPDLWRHQSRADHRQRKWPRALGNTESIARSLFTDYLLPFEVTSVLLLVAIVGAVVLAKSKLK